MITLFLACAVLGGSILLLQFLLSMLGLGHAAHDLHLGHDLHTGYGAAAQIDGHGSEHATNQALNLTGIRALAAGMAFFGIAGLATRAGGWPWWLALPVALAVGAGAMVGVATLMRWMLRFESDGTVHIESAIRQPATVYLSVPGQRSGTGKVLLTLQDRTVEYQAVTAAEELPTGTEVIVVDVVGPDTVEVVVTPQLGDDLDASH